MKKKSCFTKVAAVTLAGAIFITGCGGSDKSGSAPASDAGMTATEDAAAADDSGYGEMMDGTAPAGSYNNTESAAAASEQYASADEAEDYAYFDAEKKVMAFENSYLEGCYDEWEPGEYYNNEEYSKWDEKGFVSVMKEPLSTFSADVDTASYSNLRSLINEGY